MCDVVFITPNISGTLEQASGGTLQLATILKENKISCEILPYFEIGDIHNFSSFLENSIKALELRHPKIVSFYTRCDVYHVVLRIAEQVKMRWNDVYIVLGGPQSDITAEETLRKIPYVDYICSGEGENTVYPFFSSLLQGQPDLTVEGLVYRNDDRIIRNPRPIMMDNLDNIPFLDYSLLKTKEVLGPKTTFGIDVGRGCPFACIFCSTKSFWGRKFRLKSPNRICDEINRLHQKYGARSFKFTHDMFTLNREKVIETCNLMNNLDFDVRWGCSARLDCIDQELIDIMADSGMYGIYIGIETGSPRMQNLINKRLNLSRAEEIISYISSKNMKCVASFIYGFPDETEEDVSQTLALMAKLIKIKNVSVQAHLCAFLVGTELTERYRDHLTPAQVYSDQTGSIAVTECKDLIDANPELFYQMMEYKTDLRSKLRFFSQFWHAWQILKPVYQYFSEFYPEHRLIDMYYDFVESNQDLLERLQKIPEKCWSNLLVQEDKFMLRFAEDERFDVISDLYRLQQVAWSDEVQNGGSVTDIYCVDPTSIKEYDSLQQIPRCFALVTCTKGKYEVRASNIE